jgi:hypothetical protein
MRAGVFAILAAVPLLAQGPPLFPPQQLDSLVSRIALYPDALLAQVLAAATFSDQIPVAARWADQHHYVTGDALARDIQETSCLGIRAFKLCCRFRRCWG